MSRDLNISVAMYPFQCDCAERGVPEENGCDDECSCLDCHSTHAQATDNPCCLAFGAAGDE